MTTTREKKAERSELHTNTIKTLKTEIQNIISEYKTSKNKQLVIALNYLLDMPTESYSKEEFYALAKLIQKSLDKRDDHEYEFIQKLASVIGYDVIDLVRGQDKKIIEKFDELYEVRKFFSICHDELTNALTIYEERGLLQKRIEHNIKLKQGLLNQEKQVLTQLEIELQEKNEEWGDLKNRLYDADRFNSTLRVGFLTGYLFKGEPGYKKAPYTVREMRGSVFNEPWVGEFLKKIDKIKKRIEKKAKIVQILTNEIEKIPEKLHYQAVHLKNCQQFLFNYYQDPNYRSLEMQRYDVTNQFKQFYFYVLSDTGENILITKQKEVTSEVKPEQVESKKAPSLSSLSMLKAPTPTFKLEYKPVSSCVIL